MYFGRKRGKNLLFNKWKSSGVFFLLGCVNRELLWVSGHYTRPNEEIFVNVLYVKYNLLPLPPLGLFSHPSLKPVIFSSHPNCLSFLSAYYRKHTACFWRDFPRRWHKVYFVLPVASHWIICADNVQSAHANEVIPLRPLSWNVNFGTLEEDVLNKLWLVFHELRAAPWAHFQIYCFETASVWVVAALLYYRTTVIIFELSRRHSNLMLPSKSSNGKICGCFGGWVEYFSFTL